MEVVLLNEGGLREAVGELAKLVAVACEVLRARLESETLGDRLTARGGRRLLEVLSLSLALRVLGGESRDCFVFLTAVCRGLSDFPVLAAADCAP